MEQREGQGEAQREGKREGRREGQTLGQTVGMPLGQTVVRGIRGAINVRENTKGEIATATKEMLGQLIKENQLDQEDIISIFFTVTTDLNAMFPAVAAREIGLVSVPLLCNTEIEVPGSMPLVIRVLVLVNTTKSQQEIKHIYLRDTTSLRPDLNASVE